MDRTFRRARATLRNTATVAVLALLAACADGNPFGGTDATGELPLRTRADSAAFDAKQLARGITPRLDVNSSSVALPVFRGDRVTITLVGSECARGGNTISVTGVLSGTLTTNACYDVNAQLALGPTQQGGGIQFTGTGRFSVSGTYPNFTVKFEDGYDNDYNDALILVEIIPGLCDPVLNDPALRPELDRIMQETGWNLSLSQRQEQGGFLIEDAQGRRSFVEWNYLSQGLCHAQADITQEMALVQSGATILGVIHTHPTSGGTFMNPGNCMTYDPATKTLVPQTAQPLVFTKGPSGPDRSRWDGSNDPGYPGYVIEPGGTVYRWEKGPDGQLRRIRFNINDQCLP